MMRRHHKRLSQTPESRSAQGQADEFRKVAQHQVYVSLLRKQVAHSPTSLQMVALDVAQ